MATSLTILGVAEAGAEPVLAAALAPVLGPPLVFRRVGGLLGVAQLAPAARPALFGGGRARLMRRLHAVQRRLEVACQLGAFLPADPSAATCVEAEFGPMLAAAEAPLAAALAAAGRRHQWQVTLRWTPEAALAPRRAALAGRAGTAALAEAVAAALAEARAERASALRAALRPLVLALSPDDVSGSETETTLTVLVPAEGEAAIEAALGTLPPTLTAGMGADLQGPLPPLSFAAFRVAERDPRAIQQAWALLGLPEHADAALLNRAWRARAAALHPDRTGTETPAFHAVTDAYRLLRAALGAEGSLAELAQRARRQIIAPELPA